MEKPSSKPKKRLTKSNLEKLGKVSLKEKMKVATEDAASPEDAAIVLYNSMDKNEKAKAWSKHQTALKKASDAEKEEYENLPEKDKGIQAAAHLLEKEGKQYMATLKKVSTQDTFKQTDQWVSEKQMLQKWTAEELDAHIASGRIRWRECPGTWGVYEYKDTQDWSREVAQTRSKEFQQGNEWDPADEDLEKFLELYSKDWTSLTLDVSGKGSGKSSPGLGKGQGGKGKGQSLGKGKHRREQKEKPGIEQETDLEKVLKACKKARNMVSSCKADLELALETAKSKLSKSGQSNAMSLVTQLGEAFDQLKACLQTKDPQVKKLKEVLMKVAKVMADARDETRSSSTWATRQAPQLQVRKLATEFGKAQGCQWQRLWKEQPRSWKRPRWQGQRPKSWKRQTQKRAKGEAWHRAGDRLGKGSESLQESQEHGQLLQGRLGTGFGNGQK